MDRLLQLLIQQRMRAFRRTLPAAVTSDEPQQRVQTKILASLRVLVDTLSLVYACFIGGGGGMVASQLAALSDPSAAPTISLVKVDDAILMRALPDIIAKYK